MTKPAKLRPYSGREIAPFTAQDLIISAGDIPTVLDVVLADRLGFINPRQIRELISRNREELEAFGPLSCNTTKSGGRPAKEVHLNRQQAMLVTILSKTSIAGKVRKQMIEVFDAATGEFHPNSTSAAISLTDVMSVLAGMDRVLGEMRTMNARILENREGGKKIALTAAGEETGESFDPIGAFLTATVRSDPSGRVPARLLFRRWVEFAARNHIPVSSEIKFASWMTDRLGASVRSFVDGKDCNAYLGIRLCDPLPDAPTSPASSADEATLDVLHGIAAIAAFLGLQSPRHFLNLKREHGAPTFKIGRAVCASRSDLRAWIDAKRRASL